MNGKPITFDSSQYKYKNYDTSQPPAIRVNYYIQVYNGTYTPSNVEAAVKDLSNVTAPIQDFKNMVMLWCIPDYTATANITQPTIPSEELTTYTYIVPCHGFFCYDVLGFNSRYAQIMVNGISIFNNSTDTNEAYWNINRNDNCSKR
jgi:hypothetical protein